jgi:hypothetical protein
MTAASLIPAPGQKPTGPKLGELLERQVIAPARSMGADLSPVAVTALPPPVETRPSPNGTWWLAATFEADPVALSNGGLTQAPPEVIDQLRALRAAGVDFDFIYILHELPGEWTPGTPPPSMVLADAIPAEDRVVKIQEAVFTAGLEGLRTFAKGAGRAAGLAARGAIAAGAVAGAAVAAAATFDPVVLGGIKDPESDRIAWFALAAWDVEVPR